MTCVRRMLAVLLAVTIVLFGAACGAKQDEKPINIAVTDDIVSLDAAGTKDIVSETVARCIYATLYTFDEELNLVPCLAESAERVSDLEWVFRIRQGAKFHDGSPLTAEDVTFSLQRAMSIELAEKSLLVIDSVEAADPYTIRVKTKEPCVDLTSLFVRVSTSVMSKKAMEDPDYDFAHPVGSGPFQMVERKEGEFIRLKRFDGYFLEPAKTKFLHFIVEPSEQNRTAGLLNQNFDVLFRMSPSDCDYLKLNENVRVYEHDSTKMEIMTLNASQKPLEDIRVRQAIAHAVDRQNLVESVAGGYGKPLSSMIPPPIMGAVDCLGFEYDPDLARALLADAGYPDGFEMTVLTFDELRKIEMEFIKLDLAQVGIRLNYEFLELQDYLDVVKANEHLATIMSWTSNADPDSTFSQLYSKSGHVTVNHSRYSDARVEKLIVEGKKESDPQKRRQIYEQANRIVAESYYILPLYQPSVLVAAGSDIEGVRVNPQGIFGYENLSRIPQ